MRGKQALHASIPYAIIIALFCGIVLSQYGADQARRKDLGKLNISINELIEPSLISPNVIKKSTLGLNTVVADLLWLQTVQYYGDGDPYGHYRQLPRLMQTITALDPRFSYPYDFTGLILPNEGYSDEALAILQEGEKSRPDDWYLPYYQGTIYFLNKKDPKNAAISYARAASKPGAGPIAAFLSAVQYDKTEDEATALSLFENLAKNSTNDYFKQRAQTYVDHYQLLHDLRQVISVFKDREGHFPSELNELVQKRYVQEIPNDPLNRSINYNSADGTVTSKSSK